MDVDRFKSLIDADRTIDPTEARSEQGGTPQDGTFVDFSAYFKVGLRSPRQTRLQSLERPFLIATRDADLYPIDVIRGYRSNVVKEKLDAHEIRKELFYLQRIEQFQIADVEIFRSPLYVGSTTDSQAIWIPIELPALEYTPYGTLSDNPDKQQLKTIIDITAEFSSGTGIAYTTENFFNNSPRTSVFHSSLPWIWSLQ